MARMTLPDGAGHETNEYATTNPETIENQPEGGQDLVRTSRTNLDDTDQGENGSDLETLTPTSPSQQHQPIRDTAKMLDFMDEIRRVVREEGKRKNHSIRDHFITLHNME